MKVKFVGEFRTLKETVRDNKVFYKMGIETPDEDLEMVSCIADVANLVKDGVIKKGQQCEFSADYNTQYQSMSIKAIQALK